MTSTRPRSIARRTIPSPSGPSNRRGKIVTRSNLTCACRASVSCDLAASRSGPAARPAPRSRSAAPPGRSPARCRRPAGSALLRAVLHHEAARDPAALDATPPRRPRAVHCLDPAADQVVVVEHARRGRRRQLVGGNPQFRAPPASRRSSIDSTPSKPTTGRLALEPGRPHRQVLGSGPRADT